MKTLIVFYACIAEACWKIKEKPEIQSKVVDSQKDHKAIIEENTYLSDNYNEYQQSQYSSNSPVNPYIRQDANGNFYDERYNNVKTPYVSNQNQFSQNINNPSLSYSNQNYQISPYAQPSLYNQNQNNQFSPYIQTPYQYAPSIYQQPIPLSTPQSVYKPLSHDEKNKLLNQQQTNSQDEISQHQIQPTYQKTVYQYPPQINQKPITQKPVYKHLSNEEKNKLLNRQQSPEEIAQKLNSQQIQHRNHQMRSNGRYQRPRQIVGSTRSPTTTKSAYVPVKQFKGKIKDLDRLNVPGCGGIKCRNSYIVEGHLMPLDFPDQRCLPYFKTRIDAKNVCNSQSTCKGVSKSSHGEYYETRGGKKCPKIKEDPWLKPRA